MGSTSPPPYDNNSCISGQVSWSKDEIGGLLALTWPCPMHWMAWNNNNNNNSDKNEILSTIIKKHRRHSTGNTASNIKLTSIHSVSTTELVNLSTLPKDHHRVRRLSDTGLNNHLITGGGNLILSRFPQLRKDCVPKYKISTNRASFVEYAVPKVRSKLTQSIHMDRLSRDKKHEVHWQKGVLYFHNPPSDEIIGNNEVILDNIIRLKREV